MTSSTKFSRAFIISNEVHYEIVVAGAGQPGASEVSKAEWIEVKSIQNPAGSAFGATKIWVLCRCELGRGLSVIVKDQGQGFDPDAVPRHGRGIRLIKLAMDEVKFENNGTAVHMWKAAGREQGTWIRTSYQRVAPASSPFPWQ